MPWSSYKQCLYARDQLEKKWNQDWEQLEGLDARPGGSHVVEQKVAEAIASLLHFVKWLEQRHCR